MKNNLIFILFLITVINFSCDKVDCPNEIGCVEPEINIECFSEELGYDTCILSGPLTIHHSDTVDYRRILLEEFTGFQCPTCPPGAVKIKDLSTQLVDTFVAVAIHSGVFAEPKESGDKFLTDFRTDVGDELALQYQIFSNPNGVINRKKFNDAYGQSIPNWAPTIRSEIENFSGEVPELNVTSYFSATNRVVYVTSDLKFNTSEDHTIMFLLLEDGIIDEQQDETTYIPDYEHNHVLRASLTEAILGIQIPATDLVAGTMVNSSYFEIDPSWNTDNCELVVIMYNSNTLESVQVQKIHL